MIESGDIEEAVERTYRKAKAEVRQALSPFAIARRIYGDRSVVWVRNQIAIGQTGRSREQVFIGLRAGLPMTTARHVCGHEIGHIELGELGCRDEDIEAACDFFGAALMARRHVFANAVSGREREFHQLAIDFGATETLVALRVGEVTGIPVAVVAPHAVRARGRAEWPDEQRVRELARRGAPGLSRVRLTDDRRRVALIGEEQIDAA